MNISVKIKRESTLGSIIFETGPVVSICFDHDEQLTLEIVQRFFLNFCVCRRLALASLLLQFDPIFDCINVAIAKMYFILFVN